MGAGVAAFLLKKEAETAGFEVTGANFRAASIRKMPVGGSQS
jgi:hypothetical protein